MCASKPQQSLQKQLPGNRKIVSCVDYDTDSSEEFIAMLTIKEDISDIHTDEDKAKPYASMKNNDRLETFLLDSGAIVNVMSNKTLDHLFRKPGRKRIEKTNTTLVMYNTTEIKPVGKIRLQVINPKNLKKYSVEFLIVEENCKSILGVRASQEMKLLQVNKENIFASKTVPATRPVQPQPLTKEQLTSEYAKVFEGLGLLSGPLHLEIDETVPTVQLPVRRVRLQ